MNDRVPAPAPAPDSGPDSGPDSTSAPASTPASAPASVRHQLRRLLAPAPLVHLLFWSWHAVWLLGVVFGLAPHVLPELLVDSVRGRVPWGITACAVGLTVLPGFTLWGGWRLRHDHRRLFALFYGVGGVAFTLLVVRLFLVRQATPGVQLLLATLAAGAAFYTAELFGGLRRLGRGGAIVRLVGHTALLVIGIYTGITMGLYTVPGTVLAVPELFGAIAHGLSRASIVELLHLLAYSPFLLVFFVFVLYSFTLLLGLPVAVSVLYTRAYVRGLRAWSAERPWPWGLAITGGTVLAWGLAFAWLTAQPQQPVFERLATPPADAVAMADDLDHTDQIREGLLNAYLAPHRYWGAWGSNVQLARMYRDAFGLDHDAMGPQHLFNTLAAPLLYDGESMAGDRVRAEVRYEQFFDQPLQQGEREAVLTAVSATYDRTQAEAGLLDVGQRKVLLREQQLHARVEGDLARFTLHEIYVNQTWEQQEIFYYFSLPEHAAITGLWLGDDADPRRFAHVVAPRGAAQQVYRQQRQRRIDPALLEQVGPRQYRLRAFPIPPRSRRDDGEARPMHLWMEWTVLGDAQGWPLPRLAEARNVYWESDLTARTIDSEPASHEGWLPARLEGSVQPQPHQIDLAGVRVRAIPAEPVITPLQGRVAVVLDTSYSMQAHAAQVDRILERLTDADRTDALTVDLYLAPSPYGAELPRQIPLEQADPVYYGGHTLLGALAQFATIRGDTEYDTVIVLSDEGSFAFLQDEAMADPMGSGIGGRRGLPDPGVQTELEHYAASLRQTATTVAEARWDAPIWLLHLGGLPHAYRDEVGDLLQRTRGGVATDLDALLTRMAGGPQEGYRWTFEPLPPSASPSAFDDPFAPIAARALVAHLAAQMDLDALEGLDRIHALAVEASVVTPWSSMIVLVNDAQQEALRRASEAEDRFDREAESGTETTTTPGAALELAATPEPEQWLLLTLVLGVLLVRLRAMRRPAVAAS